MKYDDLRKELKEFYWVEDGERSRLFAEKCFAILDSKVTDDMSITDQKLMQYDVIAEEFEPIIFKTLPFYNETGVLTALSDGSRHAKGYEFTQASGWVFNRNAHKFNEQDADMVERREIQGWQEYLYLICGHFNDIGQHHNYNYGPVFEMGLKGIYEKAEKLLAEKAKTDDQKEFLKSVCHSMLVVKKMAEKFSKKAEEMAQNEANPEYKSNLELIAKTSARVPWEKPENLYEALCVLGFIRKIIGTLEGVGTNTFGRIDVELYPFYKNDIANGTLTKESAYDLICKFLLMWDMHYDHNMKMVGYADHELENTYTLGGCDKDGNPVYNEITEMFIRATRENKIIIPKIIIRFSKNSPKEYLDAIDQSIINGTSTVLFQNDDATIPALVAGGKPLDEARNYFVSGCWSVVTNQEKYDHGSYVNLLKPFEYAVHNMKDTIKRVKIDFETLENCKSFEDCYRVVRDNSEKLLRERISISRQGGQIFHTVDRFPFYSSALDGCLDKMADYTMNGAKYRDDYLLFIGFPNIIDSLLAIKHLVFDSKKYTLEQMLTAVRNNWVGYEDMQREAMKCPGWGDGSDESCEIAVRLQTDLNNVAKSMEGTYGGTVRLGHICYTEIRWWGEKTLATPDGRKNGEYFAHGLTPSRLKKIPYVTDFINSMAKLDPKTLGANTVVNIILPAGKTTLDICESFLRSIACSAVQTLQLNVTSKEQLLDAQKHPENYEDLIVRVTGFSAKFTALSPEWQHEVITRNFYE